MENMCTFAPAFESEIVGFFKFQNSTFKIAMAG